MSVKTLEAGINALGWQGGTYSQIVCEAKKLVKNGNHNKSTYEYGIANGKIHDGGIESCSIPVNSWDSDPVCTLSYIAGLSHGIFLQPNSLLK